MSSLSSYKDLRVWQYAMDVCEEVYRVTDSFPKHEMFGLVSQIRRSGVSIPSNIAEGYMRGHRPEYKHFLHIAYGSGAELETQLLISKRIGYIKEREFYKITALLNDLMKMLNKLISSLTPKP